MLDMSENYFSNAVTNELLRRIVETPVRRSLKELRMAASFDFTSIESCKKLANLLNRAESIKLCDISN